MSNGSCNMILAIYRYRLFEKLYFIFLYNITINTLIYDNHAYHAKSLLQVYIFLKSYLSFQKFTITNVS